MLAKVKDANGQDWYIYIINEKSSFWGLWEIAVGSSYKTTCPHPLARPILALKLVWATTDGEIYLCVTQSIYVHMHPFTFWFSRTDPESKMPAGL